VRQSEVAVPFGSNYLFLDAFLAPPFLAAFLAAGFFAAFFAPFLVAISLVAPFFQVLFSGSDHKIL